MTRSVQSDIDPAALSKELEKLHKVVAVWRIYYPELTTAQHKSMELNELREQYSRLEMQIEQIKEKQQSHKVCQMLWLQLTLV